jgi:hypothetical protein
MARDEAPLIARGSTYHNGDTIDSADLGGHNLEGKEYVFEPNVPIDSTANPDPSGRATRTKIVRNVSGVSLKPGRIVKYQAASTAPFGCRVDGYAITTSDLVAGVVDEFLPAAGVPNNDLFNLVIDGPSKILSGATTAVAITYGDRLVPAAYGATAGDDLGGRLAKQDLTGATAVLGNQINSVVAVAATTAATATTATLLDVLVYRSF